MGSGSKYGFETTTGLTIQQGLFEISSTAKHTIGTRMQLADGRVFYYAQAGASALAAGKLNFSVATVSGHEDCDVAVAVTAFDKEITVTPATAAGTANQYAEGWVSTRQTSGLGQFRKVKSNPAAGIAANVKLTMHDPFTAAITTSGQVDLISNPYKAVVESATEEQLPSGVPLVAVTASYYFWNQTWGLCNILQDGAVPLGSAVVPGTVAGSVKEFATATNDVQGFDQPLVGTQAILSADTLYSIVFLQLAP
jgi:hypothetical protein